MSSLCRNTDSISTRFTIQYCRPIVNLKLNLFFFSHTRSPAHLQLNMPHCHISAFKGYRKNNRMFGGWRRYQRNSSIWSDRRRRRGADWQTEDRRRNAKNQKLYTHVVGTGTGDWGLGTRDGYVQQRLRTDKAINYWLPILGAQWNGEERGGYWDLTSISAKGEKNGNWQTTPQTWR